MAGAELQRIPKLESTLTLPVFMEPASTEYIEHADFCCHALSLLITRIIIFTMEYSTL